MALLYMQNLININIVINTLSRMAWLELVARPSRGLQLLCLLI